MLNFNQQQWRLRRQSNPVRSRERGELRTSPITGVGVAANVQAERQANSVQLFRD